MSHPTALMVSYYFPPLVGIASERAASFRRHLPAHGWTPVVIAPRAGHYHRSAAELADHDVVRTRNPEISRLLRGMHPAHASSAGADTLEPVPTGTVGNALRGLVRDAVYVPDAQLAWIPFAVRAGVRALRERGGSAVVYSSSVPYSSHIAARRIARVARVPWVAEFRDPWTTGQRENRVSALRHRIDVRLHASLLRSATRVLYTSEATRREVLNEFAWLDEAKTGVVRNGFEPPDLAAIPPAPDETFVLQYAGTVTPGNDVRPVLSAVGRVNAIGIEMVKLRIAGNPEQWIAAVQALFGLVPEWLELTGMVAPDAARSLMASASANLVVMYGTAHASQVPGKLYEYIGARRPVLGVLDGHEARSIAAEFADARLVDRNDATVIESALRRLVEEHRNGCLQSPRTESTHAAALSRNAQTGLLAREFAQALR